MSVERPTLGRRERNKQEKLDRILAAAGTLFADHGVDDVTTQQIADAADIGTGTLFLYAKTKGELLLMVQNAHYADALDEGRAESVGIDDAASAVMAIVAAVVRCNRTQIENGRLYLREMAFGDATEPHHARALEITGETEQAMASAIERCTPADADRSRTLAHLVSAVMFLALASASADSSDSDIARKIRHHVDAIIGPSRACSEAPHVTNRAGRVAGASSGQADTETG